MEFGIQGSRVCGLGLKVLGVQDLGSARICDPATVQDDEEPQ